MGILDSNKVLSTPKTGLEGTSFELTCSNEAFDMFTWKGDAASEGDFLRVTYRDMYVWSSNSASHNALFMVKGKITDKPTKIDVNTENFPGLRAGADGKLPLIQRVFAVPCDFTYKWYADDSTAEKQWEKDRGTNGTDCRINVVFQNGQIYHNYPACYNNFDFFGAPRAWRKSDSTDADGVAFIDELFTKFVEGCVWDMADRKNPAKDDSLIDTGAYYYNPALIESAYEMHPAIGVGTGYSNTEGFPAFKKHKDLNGTEHTYSRFWRNNIDEPEANALTWMGGYVCDEKFTMIATYTGNTSHACRQCVFMTTDGGRNWYNVYEFAGNGRIKFYKKSESTSFIPGYYAVSPKLLLDGVTYSGDTLKVQNRVIVVPSSQNKEPEIIFEYGNALTVSGIVGTKTGITVTTSEKHGFFRGECIVFTGSANEGYNWMLNNEADGTTGGNGVMFIVNDTPSDTSFTISQYPYNTHSGLPIRHIHALNRCKDGVAVSTGEQYPQGWILYGALAKADSHAYVFPWNNDFKWVRLNSTYESVQRPLGVIVEQEIVDGKADTVVYYGADNEFTPMGEVVMPEGRNDVFSHNSTGVYRFLLKDFDNMASGECVFSERENCYCLQKIDNVFVFTGQFGAIAVSYDKGKTWTRAKMLREKPLGVEYAQFSGITDDRKLSVGNTLIQLKK